MGGVVAASLTQQGGHDLTLCVRRPVRALSVELLTGTVKLAPVILTDPAEWETWLSAPFEIAAKLQRPLPNGSLRLVPEPV